MDSQNYSADWVQSLTWGLVVGTASPIPYFYSLFFLAVLTHRCGRDFERCVRRLAVTPLPQIVTYKYCMA